VRSVAVLVCLTLLGCSAREVESAAQARELIPAEWTVAEDTSVAGDVTTVSLQLPAAKDISGLLENEEPRLVLRCIDGRVEGFIDTEHAAGADVADTASIQPVRIQFDSAPACE